MVPIRAPPAAVRQRQALPFWRVLRLLPFQVDITPLLRPEMTKCRQMHSIAKRNCGPVNETIQAGDRSLRATRLQKLSWINTTSFSGYQKLAIIYQDLLGHINARLCRIVYKSGAVLSSSITQNIMRLSECVSKVLPNPGGGGFSPSFFTLMYIARPHERYDIHTTTTKSMNSTVYVGDHPKGMSTILLRRWQAVQLAFFISSLGSVQCVSATPVGSSGVQRRDATSNGSGMSMSKKIWVPILVFCIFVFVLVVISSKSSLRRSIAGFALTGAAPTVGPGRTGAPREITAEQLAGTINGETPASRQAAPVTTRRPRRPRRTPSQMSVTSLPEYNKEPGEEELVIFRGRDMEDATMPTAVVRQSADNESSLSIDRSQVSRYSPMPTSQHNMPLLNSEDSLEEDISMHHLPLAGDEARQRRTSNAESHETSSLMRVDTNNSTDSAPAVAEPDPRGEAPPYFEVVDHESPERSAQISSPPGTSPDPTSTETDAAPASINRRSGFRSLLNRMSIVSHANVPTPHAHNRNDSGASALSALSHGRESTSRASHRTSSSIFRTISRQRSTHTLSSLRPSSPNASNARLTSPSMISLQSISAPLSHTLTRTEFTYPKTGPTPEQLRVISSREHVSRFGVPYGEEAVRFASSSRIDLHSLDPPPEFDEVVGLPREAGTSESASGSGVGSNTASEGSPSTNDAPTAPQPTDSDTPSSALQASSTITPNTRHSQSVYDSTTVTSNASTVKPTQPISEFGTLSPSSAPDRHASVRSTASYATAVETLRPSARSQQPSLSSPVGSISFSNRSRDPSVSASASEMEEFYDADDGEAGYGTESGYQSAMATPRIGGAHILEPTDATVVPERPAAEDVGVAR